MVVLGYWLNSMILKVGFIHRIQLICDSVRWHLALAQIPAMEWRAYIGLRDTAPPGKPRCNRKVYEVPGDVARFPLAGPGSGSRSGPRSELRSGSGPPSGSVPAPQPHSAYCCAQAPTARAARARAVRRRGAAPAPAAGAWSVWGEPGTEGRFLRVLSSFARPWRVWAPRGTSLRSSALRVCAVAAFLGCSTSERASWVCSPVYGLPGLRSASLRVEN